MENCTKCDLHLNRTNVVPGSGPVPCSVMLIGEAPGRDEDILGKPFVGRAGKILKEALKEAGLTRDSVYITNIVKCRPPDNRQPRIDEVRACSVYLQKELEDVRPLKVILLGRTATRHFDEVTPPDSGDPIMVHSVYHPAYALHAPDMKAVVIKRIVDALLPTSRRSLPEGDA